MDVSIFLRGSKKDFDVWEALGNDGWNWSNALKYFKLSEKNHVPRLLADKKYHSENGKLNQKFFE